MTHDPPNELVKQSIKYIPSVKFAVGVGGILGVIAIVLKFGINPRTAVVGTLIMFVLMVGLLIFARIVKLEAGRGRHLHYPAIVMLWAFLILICATLGTLFSCVFFQKPIDLHHWLAPKEMKSTEVPPAADEQGFPLSIEKGNARWEEIQASVENLRQKGPPFAYTLTENCTVTWTNYMGKRVWVKGPAGITTWSWEPLGVYIEEDAGHYYDGGLIKAVATETIPEGCYPHADGICAATAHRVQVGQAVTFRVWGYGGNGEYMYSWVGEHGEPLSTENLFTTSFQDPGVKVLWVRITSNGEFVYRDCKVIVTPRGVK